MASTIPLALLLLAQPGPCSGARGQYEALALEEALLAASQILEKDASRPLECLEVKALVHLVLNQPDDAKSALSELFERAPDHRVDDPSLSPAMRETIEAVRASVRPLAVRASARWLIHEAVRLDLLLEGGLRDATRVRWETEVLPGAERKVGEVRLAGRAATATVAVASDAEASQLRLTGQVLNDVGHVLHQFSSELLLAPRPASTERVVEVETAPTLWPIWLAVGVAVVAGGVAIGFLAQPDLPDGPDESVGRTKVP